MDSTAYTYEVKHFMLDHKEHSTDFKMLVLRLLTLYNDNVKLVSAITYVPETIILEWMAVWRKDADRYSMVGIEFVNDGSTQ